MSSYTKRFLDALLITALAILLLGVLEFTVRVGSRLTSGDWPETRMSSFRSELTTALHLYRRHPYLNVGPREGARVRAFGKQASFSTLGYRSPERSIEKPEGVVRILCAGGSTTFDILALRDEESWPWRLEAKLRHHGLPVEVWNAGFPGWTSLENLISLAIRDQELQPDWIVFFQGINDLQPASQQPFDPQYERGHAEIAHRSLGFDLEPLRWHQRSLLLEKLRNQLWGAKNPWESLTASSSRDALQTSLPTAALATYERNLRTLTTLANSRGAQVLWVPQTLRLRAEHRHTDRSLLRDWIPGIAPEKALQALEQLNDVERRLAEEGVAHLVEPVYSTWPDSSWGDAMHFSAEGSERFAAFLEDLFVRELAASSTE